MNTVQLLFWLSEQLLRHRCREGEQQGRRLAGSPQTQLQGEVERRTSLEIEVELSGLLFTL